MLGRVLVVLAAGAVATTNQRMGRVFPLFTCYQLTRTAPVGAMRRLPSGSRAPQSGRCWSTSTSRRAMPRRWGERWISAVS